MTNDNLYIEPYTHEEDFWRTYECTEGENQETKKGVAK